MYCSSDGPLCFLHIYSSIESSDSAFIQAHKTLMHVGTRMKQTQKNKTTPIMNPQVPFLNQQIVMEAMIWSFLVF